MAPLYELTQLGGIADRIGLSDLSKGDGEGLEWRSEIGNIHEP